MAEPSRDELLRWAIELDENGRGLTKWEENFVGSMIQKLNYGQRLTEREVEVLDKLYADKTPL